jgi:protoporphyrinogen/coproporphyrinogen III oxidase
LQAVAGITAQPVFHTLARWPRSMAQYTVGHAQRLRNIESRLARLPGLHLAGNAYYGIGIPDCVRTGRDAAAAIVANR